LDKIYVHIIFNLHFFDGHRVSCLWFIKKYQTKKNWKNNAMLDYKIPSLSYSSGFSSKHDTIIHLMFFKWKKLNIISSKNFKLLNYAQKWHCCFHRGNNDVFFLKKFLIDFLHMNMLATSFTNLMILLSIAQASCPLWTVYFAIVKMMCYFGKMFS
jgi:hypothetical protein